MTVVTLRRWREDDMPLLVHANTPEMTRFLGGPEDEAALRDRHERYLRLDAAGDAWMYAIEVDGVAGGGIGFWPIDHDGEPAYEAGWNVLPAWHGRGVAGEALRQVLARIREEAPPRRRVYAYPHIENAASNALCRRAGFRDLGERDFPWRGGTLPTRVWAYDLD